MGNMLHAHLFKSRQVGEREEVRIKLYYPDGTPCDLEAMEGGGGSDPQLQELLSSARALDTGHLIFAGDWSEDANYAPGDVVLWYNGANTGLYFTAANVIGGDPTSWIKLAETLDMTGTMRWQGFWGESDGVHAYGNVVRHNDVMWFSLGDVVGEPGVDPLWDRVYPDPVSAPQETLISIPNSELLSGFSEQSGQGYYTPGYRKDAMGFVHLQGMVKRNAANGAAYAPILNLPAGFRPNVSKAQYFWQSGHSGTALSGYSVMVEGSGANSTTPGNVSVAGGFAANTGYVSLDGIVFYAG